VTVPVRTQQPSTSATSTGVAGLEPVTRHVLFGLDLRCDRPIPGLPIASSAPPLASTPADDSDTVVVVWGTGPAVIADPGAAPWYISKFRDGRGRPVLEASDLVAGASVRLVFAEGAEFVVSRSGRHVTARWWPPLTDADAASYLIGPVLGFVLRLRGVTCLHASAVAIGDRAIAFAGPERSGKSTIAAALAAAGCAAISDDLVPLRPQGNRCFVDAGVPWLRPRHPGADLVRALTAAAQFTPTADEGHVDLDTRQPGYCHESRALPLAAIYVLEKSDPSGSRPRITPMRAARAITVLGSDAWMSRLMDRSMRAREFDALCRVAEHVPIRQVHVGTTSNDLDRLRTMVLKEWT
jgi:hypothetical protein